MVRGERRRRPASKHTPVHDQAEDLLGGLAAGEQPEHDQQAVDRDQELGADRHLRTILGDAAHGPAHPTDVNKSSNRERQGAQYANEHYTPLIKQHLMC